MKPDTQRPRWINTLYANFVYPLANRSQYGGLSKRMRKFEQLERLSPDENRKLQWAALLRLLQHAYDTTTFYRSRFDSVGLRPSEIASPADLGKIPPLTRDDIREHASALQSSRYRQEDLTRSATGGTTDTPVTFFYDTEAVLEKNAIQLRFNSWAGFHPGDKVFYLWGARQDYSENPSWRWRLYDRGVMRRVWAPTSLFNDSVLESFRQTLNRFRPRIVYAYPTPLALFCEYLRRNRRPYWRPLSAICTAEPLLDHQRNLIKEVLECPVFEHYGSRDFAMIGAECECHEGLHLNTAAAYVEFLPVEGAEVDGLHELLVTDLLNHGMPLIRYRINDCTLLRPGPCPCGRGYPLLKRVMGRTTDIFHLRDGTVVPGISLQNRVIGVCPGIKKIQVIQTTLDEFTLRYVPGQTFQTNDLELLKGNLAKYFSNKVQWTFEQVAEIERERSGKTRFCISRVSHPTTARG